MDYITRGQWGFRGRIRPSMSLPSNGARLHHSVTTATNNPNADMRTLESIGINRFGYLSYSWAVHPSGVILQGQGNRVGAHTAGRNSSEHGIVLIGNYETSRPSQAMLDAVAELLAHGHRQNWWRRATLLGGHNDVGATACPGRHAYSQISAINRAATSSPAPPKDEDMPLNAQDLAQIRAIVAPIRDQVDRIQSRLVREYGESPINTGSVRDELDRLRRSHRLILDAVGIDREGRDDLP